MSAPAPSPVGTPSQSALENKLGGLLMSQAKLIILV
jgi:hypothetical protein